MPSTLVLSASAISSGRRAIVANPRNHPMKVRVLIVVDTVYWEVPVFDFCYADAYLLSRYVHRIATAINELVNQIVK